MTIHLHTYLRSLASLYVYMQHLVLRFDLHLHFTNFTAWVG